LENIEIGILSTDCSVGVIWPVLDASDVAFDIELSTDQTELRKMAEEFSRCSMKNCLGVIQQSMVGLRRQGSLSFRSG
jgi:hypothetical protein